MTKKYDVLIKLNKMFVSDEASRNIRSIIKCNDISSVSFRDRAIFCVYFNPSQNGFYNYGLAAIPIPSINIFAPLALNLIFTAAADNRKSEITIHKNLKKSVEDFDYEGLKQAIKVAKKIIKVLECK